MKISKKKQLSNKRYMLNPYNRYAANTRSRKYSRKIKLIVFKYYSQGKLECACCGENHYEFLTLDHINNDGSKDRQTPRTVIHMRLMKECFPHGYRILCYNCNCSRGHHGYCPHRRDF